MGRKMSEWKDALIDYVHNNLPEDFELLPKYYQDNVLAQLEKDFVEGVCCRAESIHDMMEDR